LNGPSQALLCQSEAGHQFHPPNQENSLQYVINDVKSLAQDTTDPLTGLSINARGGSELMFKRIMDGIGPEYTDRFQFISSRVRKIDPNKKQILILNDTWNDPESAHLKNPESRARFAQLAFVSQHQFTTYHMGLGVPYAGSTIMRNAIVPFEEVTKNKSEKIRLIYHTTPHRGLELLIPVFLELVKMRPNLHLDVYSSFSIYGWSERDKPYEKLFDICRQHPNITYHGAVSNDRIRAALRAADIFAYPSIWPETSCIAAMEAMSAGVAIVAPDYAALSETLFSYGYQYRWTENVQEHMQIFANVLLNVIDNYQSGGVQMNLEYQKRFADRHYNIESRVNQWKALLDRL
jgi:glycosyltransferase involved in cell wall biosynthesis